MDELEVMVSDMEKDTMKFRKEVEQKIEMQGGKNVGMVDALSVSHRLFLLEIGLHNAWKELRERG